MGIGGNTMAEPKLSAEDKKWRAQDDAYTLARAAEITASKPRVNAAKAAAKTMLQEQQQKTKALAKVAKTPVAKKATPKKAAVKKAAPKKTAAKRRK